MSEIKLSLLGTPQLTIDGQAIKVERKKSIALLAYLAMTEQPQSRDVLTALLWPESNHEQARATLRSTLSALTRLTDARWIHADRATISLNHEAVWVDVAVFKRCIQQMAAHDHTANPTTCADCHEAHLTAEALYSGDFLNGFYISDSYEFEDWQIQQREWLRREYTGVQRRLSLYFLEHKQYEPALHHTREWLACDPLAENAHRQLMQLYAITGQRAALKQQYQRCVALLDEAFATPPEYETTQLYESLLRSTSDGGTPSIKSDGGHVVSAMPPLPSLVIGRAEALAEIKARLGVGAEAARPITVMHGWPGVGKSTTAALLTHDADIAACFPDGVLWASLGETPDLLSEISRWADVLGIHDTMTGRTIDDISAQTAALIRDKRMLLVIDDVWQTEHTRPFRIGGQHSKTLMTSRLFDVALALAPTADDVYRLPVLSETASLELLGKLTPQTVAQYPDEARQLVNDLEGLPLAIHVAGRLLHVESSMGWGVRELLVELRDGASLLAAQPPSEVLLVGRDASPTVAALLKRSTDRLTPEMRLQFALLGLFVPKPATFDLEAMSVAWDTADPRPITRRLVNHGLLEPVSDGRFQMHALLVLHAQSLLNSEFEA